ncbi:MAG: hypothetical protein AAGF33_04930 [Pseudomonadota bacterium]
MRRLLQNSVVRLFTGRHRFVVDCDFDGISVNVSNLPIEVFTQRRFPIRSGVYGALSSDTKLLLFRRHRLWGLLQPPSYFSLDCEGLVEVNPYFARRIFGVGLLAFSAVAFAVGVASIPATLDGRAPAYMQAFILSVIGLLYAGMVLERASTLTAFKALLVAVVEPN